MPKPKFTNCYSQSNARFTNTPTRQQLSIQTSQVHIQSQQVSLNIHKYHCKIHIYLYKVSQKIFNINSIYSCSAHDSDKPTYKSNMVSAYSANFPTAHSIPTRKCSLHKSFISTGTSYSK